MIRCIQPKELERKDISEEQKSIREVCSNKSQHSDNTLIKAQTISFKEWIALRVEEIILCQKIRLMRDSCMEMEQVEDFQTQRFPRNSAEFNPKSKTRSPTSSLCKKISQIDRCSTRTLLSMPILTLKSKTSDTRQVIQLIRKMRPYESALLDVTYHPTMPPMSQAAQPSTYEVAAIVAVCILSKLRCASRICQIAATLAQVESRVAFQSVSHLWELKLKASMTKISISMAPTTPSISMIFILQNDPAKSPQRVELRITQSIKITKATTKLWCSNPTALTTHNSSMQIHLKDMQMAIASNKIQTDTKNSILVDSVVLKTIMETNLEWMVDPVIILLISLAQHWWTRIPTLARTMWQIHLLRQHLMAFQAQAFAPVEQAHSLTSKIIRLKRLQTTRLTVCSKNPQERSTIRAIRTLCSSLSRDQVKPILLQPPLLAQSISIMRPAVITAMVKMKRRRRSPPLLKETMAKKMTAKKAQSQTTITLLRKLFSTIRMLEAITILSSTTIAYKEAIPILTSTTCEREMVVMLTEVQTTVELIRCLHRDTTRAVLTTSCLHNSSKSLPFLTVLVPKPILITGLKWCNRVAILLVKIVLINTVLTRRCVHRCLQ